MRKIFSLIFMLGLTLALTACGGEEDTLVMGFVPSQDSENIANTIEPLADRLSEELDINVEGKVMTNYNSLVEAMGSNQVQIGFIPAFGYVLANEQYDVEVILKSIRDGEGSYKAEYDGRADADSDSLDDLEGKRWTFADKGSTAGYLFPAQQLMKKYGFDSASDLETEFFGNTTEAGSHDTAALAVLDGDADGATTFDDVRDNLEDEYTDINDDLKVIDYTESIPNDTISVTKELDDDLVEKIKEAFLSFNEIGRAHV